MIRYQNKTVEPVFSDNTRIENGIAQVAFNGNFTSIFEHRLTLTNQTGSTISLDGEVTDLGLTLVYPQHFLLQVKIFRNGVLLESSEFTYESTGVITFSDQLTESNIVIFLK